MGIQRPVLLMILDGWGLGEAGDGNAITLAGTPQLDRLRREYSSTTLCSSGEAVGLLAGQMGDSNVGHLNMGAGRIVYQDLTRISRAVDDGSINHNVALNEAMTGAAATGATLHLCGLLSDGGVHSHSSHLYALLEMAGRSGVRDLCVHAFLDGRDVGPASAGEYLEALEERLAGGPGVIATVMGRYYAMDRDRRWERVEQAYSAMVSGEGRRAHSARQALAEAYARGETDEFVAPTVICDRADKPLGRVKAGDSLIFFNFRSDRAREISYAFTDPEFTGFHRQRGFFPLHYLTLTHYADDLAVAVAFPPQSIRNSLGEVVSQAGISQLRIAETEKYAHVTFFFSGGQETPFPGEDRRLIPSPAVATYDLLPEMSAYGVRNAVGEAIAARQYGLIVLNFANLDMVGHTGNLAAAMEAVKVVDTCAGQVTAAMLAQGGSVLIVSDHGNVEQMVDCQTGGPQTAHTANPVPGILIDPSRPQAKLRSGILADVAPTVLHLMGLPKPVEMTGKSLLEDSEATEEGKKCGQ